MSANFSWRRLRKTDLEAVAAIAAAAFPQHPENPACFAERLELSPAWCYGLEDGAGALAGYLIAYPWPLGAIPPLNALVHGLPERASALFLHDLALHPRAAGSGQARAIVDRLAVGGRDAGFQDLALVAVNDTAEFWKRQGFAEVAGEPSLQAKLASYGEGARYMRRTLGSAIS